MQQQPNGLSPIWAIDLYERRFFRNGNTEAQCMECGQSFESSQLAAMTGHIVHKHPEYAVKLLAKQLAFGHGTPKQRRTTNGEAKEEQECGPTSPLSAATPSPLVERAGNVNNMDGAVDKEHHGTCCYAHAMPNDANATSPRATTASPQQSVSRSGASKNSVTPSCCPNNDHQQQEDMGEYASSSSSSSPPFSWRTVPNNLSSSQNKPNTNSRCSDTESCSNDGTPSITTTIDSFGKEWRSLLMQVPPTGPQWPDQRVMTGNAEQLWAVGALEIHRKSGGGRKRSGREAQIFVPSVGKSVPIPDNPLPSAVIGFKSIEINYIDNNVMAFLRAVLRQSDGLNFVNGAPCGEIAEFFLRDIWPLVKGSICGMELYAPDLQRMRKYAPAILCDCPRLKNILSQAIFPTFPASDSANASNAQAVAKWLSIGRADGVPKLLQCNLHSSMDKFVLQMESFKQQFDIASSPVSFIVAVWCLTADEHGIVPFVLTNGRTGEQLTLKRVDNGIWLLVRCPTECDERKWAAWETEAIEWDMEKQWNNLTIFVNTEDIGDGLLNSAKRRDCRRRAAATERN